MYRAINAVDDQDIMDIPHYEVIKNPSCEEEEVPDSVSIASPASSCDIIVQNPDPVCLWGYCDVNKKRNSFFS